MSNELAAMRADSLLSLQFRSNSYGPSIVAGDGAKLLKESCPKTLDKYNPAIEFIATKFGDKGVSELERIATALYVKQNDDTDGSVESRAQRIIELKPHVEIDLARDAVKFVDVLIEEDGPMLLHGLKELHNSHIVLPSSKAHWPKQEYLERRYQKFREAV